MHSDCLIIGYGDIAKRTARRLYNQGSAVTVVGRTVPLDENGPLFFKALQADLDQPRSLEQLSTAGFRILYLAPPASTGDVDSRVRNFCDRLTMRLPTTPLGIVYVSTSGVYGDCAGEIVDEMRPVNPQTARAQRRVDAENVLQQWGAAHLVPVVILRVAGIYGPGRLPLQRLQAGMPVLLPEQSPFSSTIHSDDLARICCAALLQVEKQGVFNVCDGEERRMSDYFLAVARIFDLPEPPGINLSEARQQFSPEMLSYLGESRRLDNRQLLNRLKIKLLYPTLVSGLQAIRHQSEKNENDL